MIPGRALALMRRERRRVVVFGWLHVSDGVILSHDLHERRRNRGLLGLQFTDVDLLIGGFVDALDDYFTDSPRFGGGTATAQNTGMKFL